MDKQTKDVIEAHLYYVRESLTDLKETNRSILKRLNTTEKILLRNTVTVEDHKKRSDIADANHAEFVKVQREVIDSLQSLSLKVSHIDSELKPIKVHVKSVSRIMKLFIAMDENKMTIAKILGFIIVVAMTAYFGINEINLGSFIK